MRQRHDYYTLCPACESRMLLTLSARLQAGRNGTSCVCSASQCNHEWVCIQEWIYRNIDTPRSMTPPQAPIVTHAPAASMSPPRPHLPTFQPPQPTPPAPVAVEHPTVPAPHAWSWQRQAEQQRTTQSDHNAFGS